MRKDDLIVRKKAKFPLDTGNVIVGKWNQNKYTILRPIGSGMVGTVYLCKRAHKLYALKISSTPMALTREVSVLKAFNKVRDQHLGPYLFDVDDWEVYNGLTYSFYVMEYVHGVSFSTFVKKNGTEWIGRFLIQMLETLEQIHQNGFVFGDLKNDNLLVTELKEPTVRFIDVGGVTKMGQSVKEYSNFYDRAYWQLGSRKAEPSYDLFALVMIVLAIFYPKQFSRTRAPKEQIMKHILRVPSLRAFHPVLKKVLLGSYSTAAEMKVDLQRLMNADAQKERRRRPSYFAQAVMISCIASIYYILSLLF